MLAITILLPTSKHQICLKEEKMHEPLFLLYTRFEDSDLNAYPLPMRLPLLPALRLPSTGKATTKAIAEARLGLDFDRDLGPGNSIDSATDQRTLDLDVDPGSSLALWIQLLLLPLPHPFPRSFQARTGVTLSLLIPLCFILPLL